MKDVAQRRVADFTMWIVRHERFARSRVFAADGPVVAAGIGVHVLNDIAAVFAGPEQRGIRRYDLRFRKRAATAAAERDIVANEVEVQSWRNDDLAPRVRHALPRCLLDADTFDETREREFAVVRGS